MLDTAEAHTNVRANSNHSAISLQIAVRRAIPRALTVRDRGCLTADLTRRVGRKIDPFSLRLPGIRHRDIISYSTLYSRRPDSGLVKQANTARKPSGQIKIARADASHYFSRKPLAPSLALCISTSSHRRRFGHDSHAQPQLSGSFIATSY